MAGALHELEPRILIRQAIEPVGGAAKGVESLWGDWLQANRLQGLHGRLFIVRVALKANCFPLGQRDEFPAFFGADIHVGIAKNHAGNVERAANKIGRIVTPAALAVRMQGVQQQDWL